MKILFISPSFYPSNYYGGPIYSTYELAKALKKTGADVRVITTNANGNNKLKLETGVVHNLETELPVKYFRTLDSRGTSISMLLNLRKEIKEADVIYLISIFSPPTPFVILFCKVQHKFLIISPRGQLGAWCLAQGNRFKKLWLSIFLRPFIKNVNWHLTSNEEQHNVLKLFPESKTFVIPNGIKLESSEIIEKRKNKLFYKRYSELIDENSKVIISMGRIHMKKGFDILIDAYKIVQRQMQNSKLFIAGEDFGEKANLLKIISANNLSEQVYLVGHIEGEEKMNFLKNADVFALPSHDENFGMVYGEALATGTPIVASKNTPWQDTEKYYFGKWIENTPVKFAQAIIAVLISDNFQMGLNGRKYIEENLSWTKIAEEFKYKISQIL